MEQVGKISWVPSNFPEQGFRKKWRRLYEVASSYTDRFFFPHTYISNIPIPKFIKMHVLFKYIYTYPFPGQIKLPYPMLNPALLNIINLCHLVLRVTHDSVQI